MDILQVLDDIWELSTVKVLAMCDVLKIELGQLTNGVPTWVTCDIYPRAVLLSVQILDQVAHAQNDVGWSPSSRTSTER